MVALVIAQCVGPVDNHRLRVQGITARIAAQHFAFHSGEEKNAPAAALENDDSPRAT